MSLAEQTREAARRRPFLVAALRAGVVNYTAAARWLSGEVDGDTDAVATALRRFAETLPDRETEDRSVRVSMESGLGEIDDDADGAAGDTDAMLSVGGVALAPGAGSLTGVLAAGDVGASALAHVLARLDTADVDVLAAGVGGESLLVAVERRDGPDAVRAVEDALAAVPAGGGA